MKKLIAIGLVCALLPVFSFSQTSKKSKGTSIHAATTFNYYSSLKPYKFVDQYLARYDELVLTFLTNNSGTFVIEPGDSLYLERTLSSHMPSQLIGVGTSIQFKKSNGLFHEIALTKLSFTKSSRSLIYTYTDTSNHEFRHTLGYEEKMFALGLRYEFGKYFGKRKDAKVRFGISGGIEPSFYRFYRRPFSSSEYPLKAKLVTIDIALIPMLSVSLSKKLSLDFKIVPNFLTADFGKMTGQNPSLTKRQQGGIREYKSPDMTWAFSVLLRYTVKEAKKKKGDE